MRANVAKALEGSLAHTKWLFSLVEQTNAVRASDKAEHEKSLAGYLLLALDTDKNGK